MDETVHSPLVPSIGPSEQGSPTGGSLRSRVIALSKTEAFTKIWRYGAVSVISTVITLVCLYLFYRVVRVGSAGLANVLATAIATVPSYSLNRTWAWGKTGKSRLWREIVPFWVIAAIGLVLSTVAVQFASHEAKDLSHAHQVQTILVLFANLFTYGVMWVGKFLLFNGVLFKKDRTPDAVEIGAGSSSGCGAGEGELTAEVG